MSLQGQVNKISGDFRRAVESMAMARLTGPDGAVRGTRKIVGYVCNIHEDGDLKGTIDVQEYNFEAGEYKNYEGARHHEGVLLSAIQDNTDGVFIVPMLYSEVVIVQNPLDGLEYVLMYSHAKRIQMQARSTEGEEGSEISIGVTEVEQFNESDDGIENDFNELEPTKNKTITKYTATSITDQVTSPDDEVGLTQEKTAASKTIKVGNTTITIDGENVTIETSGQVSFKIGGTEITNSDGEITVKTDTINVESSDCTVKTDTCKVEASDCAIKSDTCKVDGSDVTITGGNLTVKGTSNTDLMGPFNAIKACPFSGAPHCGSKVSGT